MHNNSDIIIKSLSIGFSGILQIVFIVLKLINVITWSWWLVLLPVIIHIHLILLALILRIIITASNKETLK